MPANQDGRPRKVYQHTSSDFFVADWKHRCKQRLASLCGISISATATQPRTDMEQLEIHSKSYLIRWIYVSDGHTVAWSLQPHKKSINFGLFKHPGTSNGLNPSPQSITTGEVPLTPGLDPPTRPRRASTTTSRTEHSTVVEKLETIGLKRISWLGKCEADKVAMGKHDVPEGEGGMYGLVFDNTFSKQVSKTVTFVSLTYPTNTPPKSGHHLHFSQALPTSSTTSLSSSKQSPKLDPATVLTETLSTEKAVHCDPRKGVHCDPRPKTTQPTESRSPSGSTFFTGVLRKKRRRKNQGFARRFFSLDFTSSTLSYYQNRHSSALRGSIPLALAAVGMDEKRREISVDSGAEVWHLRAANQKDFEAWKRALERASQSASAVRSPHDANPLGLSALPRVPSTPMEDRDWGRVESLVGRVAGTRDAVRRLAKDTDPKYLPAASLLGKANAQANAIASPLETPSNEYFREEDRLADRKPFWKRKTSSGAASPSSMFRRTISAGQAPTFQVATPQSSNGLHLPKTRDGPSTSQLETMHEHCMALLRDLDSVVAEFSHLIAERKQRQLPLSLELSRRSIDSTASQEFFDAEDGDPNQSQLLTIRRDSSERLERDDASDGDDSASSIEGGDGTAFERQSREGQLSFFPSPPKSLTPLPLDPVRRRDTVLAPTSPPPSLIGFLRKNVGKDLSTIAMPVSANEPLSLLQRTSEQMEYSGLLDAAVSAGVSPKERLLYVTAFAISVLSNSRVKERAIRKPFNPMLGETFELVREDRGFRFLAEKVSHRPVRIACQAEAKEWSFTQSPMPTQKFWGKSVELNTEGRARVALHATGEHYSWANATCFLRNIIAGEKYVEPVQTMTVINETTGEKAVVTFKAKGMFSGRSEDVVVQTFDAHNQEQDLGLVGKWTSHLNLTYNATDTGKTIWTTNGLVDNAPTRYGFTSFAASLNEITPIEESHIPMTDSRRRPDQRAAENGELDRAEALKARLEERQRARRKVLEEQGKEWVPKWFGKVADAERDEEEVWRLKGGREGYWECRAEGRWDGVWDVFETQQTGRKDEPY